MKTSVLLHIGLLLAMANHLGAQGASPHSASPPLAAAQGPLANAAPSCDYNACALRTKISRGNRLIIRGEHEERVGRLGMFSATNLESIVASSPEAAAEARVFKKNYRPGEFFSFLGAFTMVFSGSVASGSDSAFWPVTGVVVGGSMLFYGVHRHVRAQNSLSKTIWLYNGSLKR
jgi:hypothetical protein